MRAGQGFLLFLVGAAFAGMAAVAGATDMKDESITVEQARSAILEGCIDSGGEDRACTCYVDTLHDTLPQQSYERMMILAAYAMLGDDEAGMAFMTRHGMTGSDFLPMMVEWQGAVIKSSQTCGL